MHVALEQHAVGVGERGDQRGRARRRPCAANLIPSAEPWSDGLTTIGNPRRSSIAPSASAAPSSLNAASLKAKKSGVGMPRVAEGVLGQHLVGAAHARADARAGVGDAEDLEQLLHRAVLAVAAVQRDERRVGLELAQARDEVVADVEAEHLVAEALERVLDPRARAAARRRARASGRP